MPACERRKDEPPRRGRGVARVAVVLVAMVASSASPSIVAAADAPALRCRVTVYANDPDPSGTNLRAGPGATHPVVARIADDDASLDVVGAVGPWLRVARVRAADGRVAFAGDAWIHGPLTAVRAIGRVTLRAAPDARAASSGTMDADAVGAVDGCDDGWVRVRGAARGWIAPGQWCGNPVSNCV